MSTSGPYISNLTRKRLDRLVGAIASADSPLAERVDIISGAEYNRRCREYAGEDEYPSRRFGRSLRDNAIVLDVKLARAVPDAAEAVMRIYRAVRSLEHDGQIQEDGVHMYAKITSNYGCPTDAADDNAQIVLDYPDDVKSRLA